MADCKYVYSAATPISCCDLHLHTHPALQQAVQYVAAVGKLLPYCYCYDSGWAPWGGVVEANESHSILQAASVAS